MPEGLAPSASGSEANCHRFAISPGGRIRIDFYATEVRNNEWFEAPLVRDLEGGTIILELSHPWDAHERWTGANSFALIIGKAQSSKAVTAHFDVDAGTITIEERGKTYPIGKAERAIKKALARQRSIGRIWPASTTTSGPAPNLAQPRDWKALILGTLVALLFVALVAIGSYWWHANGAPEPAPNPPAPTPLPLRT